MELKNFSLGDLDDFTSKSKLAQILKISSRTIWQYHQIAMLIEDFENDYPSITRGSKAITKAALTKYQVWVLFSLLLVTRRLSRGDVYQCILKNENAEFTAKFSKDSYYKLTQGDINNDITTICKAA